MRLWSVHARHLDTVGLVACWREALLAQRVLTGTTRGYRRHAQLERFLPGSALAAESRGTGPDALLGAAGPDDGWPGDLIVAYLHALADEASARGHSYDVARIAGPRPDVGPVPVTDGQVAHEWALLSRKLAGRSPAVLERWAGVVVPDVHPLFVVVPGPVARWERVTAPGG